MADQRMNFAGQLSDRQVIFKNKLELNSIFFKYLAVVYGRHAPLEDVGLRGDVGVGHLEQLGEVAKVAPAFQYISNNSIIFLFRLIVEPRHGSLSAGVEHHPQRVHVRGRSLAEALGAGAEAKKGLLVHPAT